MRTEPSTNATTAVRRTSNLRWLLLFAVAVIAAYGVSWYRSSPGEGWPTDLAQARTAAAASGRPLLIQFSSQSCPFCVRMEREVLPNPAVVRLLKGFELAQVDAWADAQSAERYGVQSIPAYVVLDPQGRPISKIEGYLPAETFIDFLDRASQTAIAPP